MIDRAEIERLRARIDANTFTWRTVLMLLSDYESFEEVQERCPVTQGLYETVSNAAREALTEIGRMRRERGAEAEALRCAFEILADEDDWEITGSRILSVLDRVDAWQSLKLLETHNREIEALWCCGNCKFPLWGTEKCGNKKSEMFGKIIRGDWSCKECRPRKSGSV